MNPARKKRLYVIVALLLSLGLATFFTLQALRHNLMYFYTPSSVAEAPTNSRIRIGGMVVAGSVQRATNNTLNVQFVISDTSDTLTIHYDGILPDLFAEGQGVVAEGRFADGVFIADTVLAKHDENYMPPDVAAALRDAKTTTSP